MSLKNVPTLKPDYTPGLTTMICRGCGDGFTARALDDPLFDLCAPCVEQPAQELAMWRAKAKAIAGEEVTRFGELLRDTAELSRAHGYVAMVGFSHFEAGTTKMAPASEDATPYANLGAALEAYAKLLRAVGMPFKAIVPEYAMSAILMTQNGDAALSFSLQRPKANGARLTS